MVFNGPFQLKRSYDDTRGDVNSSPFFLMKSNLREVSKQISFFLFLQGQRNSCFICGPGAWVVKQQT